MKALFHTGGPSGWGEALGGHPWSLAPVGGKPLIEYWLEWAASLGISDVRLVLGDGAEEVEAYADDGSRWGLQITYGFLKPGISPESYLRRSPEQWQEGLLYIAAPVFPRRLLDRDADGKSRLPVPGPEGCWLVPACQGAAACFLSSDARTIRSFIAGTAPATSRDWAALGIDPLVLADMKAYYQLNQRLVKGEIVRYVRPGFGGGDGAYIGSNVIIPPSVELRPPLIIGNDCRLHPMAVIGPDVVIGNRVIVDRQTEIANSVILDGTYLGRNLEIRDRVVAGARLIEPDTGTILDIEDPWLLAPLGVSFRLVDGVRAVLGWAAAVVLLLLQAIPFALLYLLLRGMGMGRFRLSQRLAVRAMRRRLPFWSATDESSRLHRLFTGLSLDLLPMLALTALGQLWLCGHTPLHPERDAELRSRLRCYYPAAISYQTLALDDACRSEKTANALYYERYRSPLEDCRILLNVLIRRFLMMLAGR